MVLELPSGIDLMQLLESEVEFEYIPYGVKITFENDYMGVSMDFDLALVIYDDYSVAEVETYDEKKLLELKLTEGIVVGKLTDGSCVIAYSTIVDDDGRISVSILPISETLLYHLSLVVQEMKNNAEPNED